MGRRRLSTAVAAGPSRAARGGASRAQTYLPAWLIWLALPLAGALFWALASAGTAAAVAIGAALTLGSAALVLHTFRVFSQRRDATVCWDAAITVGLACAWVFLTAMFGLFHDPGVGLWPHFWNIFEWLAKSFTLPIWGTWAAGGPILALVWNIRRAARTDPASEGEHQKEIESPLAKALGGAKLLQLEANELGQVTGVLQGDRGAQTSADLQGLAGAIESAERLREGAVRIAKDPKDRSRALVTIVPNDPLEKEWAWPGPSLPGGHLADAPIPFAMAEDGVIEGVWFNGDEVKGRNLVHFLVEGTNGSGKSMGWRAAIADALTRTAGAGVRLHGVDVSGKWRQTFGPLIQYMTSLAIENKAAKKLIRELSAHVKTKQERMGAAGHTQWSRDCGEPFEIFWLEEGSEIASESQELTRAAERWRSAGVMIIIVIQRASWDAIDTTTRSQMGGATAFGVNDGGASSNCLSLPDAAKDQGADPARWGSRHPGKHYLIHSTTPEERMAIPHRSPKTTNEELAAALQEHCTPMRDSAGQPLTGYTSGSPADAATPAPAQRSAGDATFNPNSPVEALGYLDGQGIDMALSDQDKETLRRARAAQQDDEQENDDDMVPLPPDPDPNIKVDPTQPIKAPTEEENLPLSVPGAGGPKIAKADFQALIQRHLAAILHEGRDRTRAADVHQMRPETGYSREAVRLELVRLCNGPHTDLDVHRLRRDDADPLGVYGIYVAELAHAG